MAGPPGQLSFLGAAQSVTGSRYLLETAGRRVLVDCGLNQERDQSSWNWQPLSTGTDKIDAVLLTHAHLDHCGLLPRLVREGFSGPIYCTAPTARIGRIVMVDSARLQAEDAEAKRRRHERENRRGPRPPEALYTERDAEKAASLFRSVRLEEPVHLAPDLEAEFFEAGHILGSASIRVRVQGNGSSRTILFSGDIGRWNKAILKDPRPCDQADYLLMESTYGDSLHEGEDRIQDALGEIVGRTVEAGGNIVIPSFAVERSQEVLYYLNRLLLADRIPQLLVFLDSPMATKVTEIFSQFPDYLDAETLTLISENRSPFELPTLVMARTTQESKAINRIRGSAIIISGAGMCTGGRIKHHLQRNISRPESTILFVGYQAAGTLGRSIADGALEVRILGETMPVRARIARLAGFSGHADRDELLRWASCITRGPRRAFVTHGEPETAARFRDLLAARMGWDVSVPSRGQVIELE